MCCGNTDRRCLKYIYGLRLFSLALSDILYASALASAPFTELNSTQFFLPMQNGRIARSLAELSIGTLPSVRNTFRFFSWLILYLRPSAVFPLGRIFPEVSCSSICFEDTMIILVEFFWMIMMPGLLILI